jgi:uncharacterized protein
MANPTYPGVYVEEVASGVRPIQAVGTSTPAFVGQAEMGPDDEARKITSWTEFGRVYGSFIADGFLAESVFQFFNNGGQECYVVRVARDDAAAASVTVKNRNPAVAEGLSFTAKTKGAWGNQMALAIEDGSLDPGNELALRVGRDSGGAPLEVHDNLSMDPTAPNFIAHVVSARSNLIGVSVLDKKSLQAGRHRGGGAPAVPPAAKRSFMIDVDHDGLQQVDLAEPIAEVADLPKAIQDAVRALAKKRDTTPAAAFTGFTCSLDDNGLLLTSGSTDNPQSSVVIQRAADGNATGFLKIGAADGGVSEEALAIRRPANVAELHLGDNPVAGDVTKVQPGSDGSGNASVTMFASGFSQLDNKTDFSLLAVPGENSTAMVDAGLTYCANRPLRDVFYIGEMSQHDDDIEDAKEFRSRLTNPNSYGAVYFPWVKALDPRGTSPEPVLLPPSGYVAGLYARSDANRGVWKAPAGTSATLGGVVGLAVELTDVQHGDLNPLGINVIRRFTTSGVVAFGARTISSDPEWAYVPVRRMAIMLRSSVYYGIQWAVFEPNDEVLWSQLRQNVTSFMMNLFRQGAFQGTSPSDAFFVKCDGETTTQGDIDLGVVNLELGFAPLKPAEFVVVRISQSAGQAA